MSAPLDARARVVLPDEEAVRRHAASVGDLRRKRDAAASAVPDFEALRDHAAAVKDHVLDHLDELLEDFETRARAAGAVVHWAADARAHNEIVHGLLFERGAARVVKSKSMLTEECGLNPYLEERGLEVVDTDLGERIVQLGAEPPSHIIVPAVHRSRGQIGELFHRHLGTPAGETDPLRLTRAARSELRRRFLSADAALSGANFAIAETGSIVIVTNEGNADLGTSLAPLHVASIGIEKLLPAWRDLPTFLRLLARSATGQPITAYTSVLTGPRPGAELHLVLVDNGRSRLLANPEHRRALACIRCGACLNTCPVYRRAGGHAYGQAIPGPIGAVLGPALVESAEARSLPHASSLCGSCSAVCPVRIDLHGQLLAWRRERPSLGRAEQLAVRLAAAVLMRPGRVTWAGRILRRVWPLLTRRFPGNPLGPWLESRELPERPQESFRERWLREQGRA